MADGQPGRRARLRARGDLLAVVGAIVAGAVGIVLSTRGSYFTTDDHVFFAQALEQPFGLHFLTDPIYDHFSPWHRLQDQLIASVTHQGWWLALTISLLWYAACVGAFTLVVRSIVGRHPAGTLVCIVFALSPVFVRAAQWWALAAQMLPQVCFTLLATWAALRWAQTRRALWVALSLGFFALALMGFIKGLLALGFIAWVLYLLPTGDRPLRVVPDLILRRDRWLWLGLAGLSVAYVIIISADRYYRFIGQAPGPGKALWAEYLLTGWTQGVAPLSLDATIPPHPGVGNWIVVVACQAAILGFAAWGVFRRPTLLGTWLGAGTIALAALVMSGQARLTSAGVDFVALDPRYVIEGALATLLALAVTAHAVWPSLSWPAMPRRAWIAGLATVAVCAGLATDAFTRLERSWTPGPQNRRYFAELDRSLDALAQRGVRPAILDGSTPEFIVPTAITGANLLSRVLPLHRSDVRVGTPTGPPATIDPDGRVRLIDPRVERSGDVRALARARVLTPAPPPGQPLCIGAGAGQRPFGVLVPNAKAPDRARVLQLDFTTPLRRPVTGTINTHNGGPDRAVVNGVAVPTNQTAPLRIRPGQRGIRLIVAYGPVTALGLRLDPGSQICIRSLTVASFRPRLPT